MPVVDLRRDNPEPAAVALVPEDVTRRFMVVPLRLDEQALHVAVADRPTDELRTLLAQASEHSVDFVLAPEADIRWAIDSSYRAIGGVDQLVQAFEAVESARKKELEAPAAEVVDDDAPVVQVVDRILTQAMRDRASDVHIEPSQDVVRVRFRIDGALKEVLLAARRHGPRSGQPHQDHGGHEHRRAPPSPGRPAHDGDRRQAPTSGWPPSPPSGARSASCGSSTRPARSCASTTSACRPTPTRPTRSWSGRPSAWCCAPARPAAARRPRSTPRSARSTIPPATS